MISLYLAIVGELFYHYGTFFLKRWKDPTIPYEWDYFFIMVIAMMITYAAFLHGLLGNIVHDIAIVFASNKAGRVILTGLRIIL
jgi:hypothetical protein